VPFSHETDIFVSRPRGAASDDRSSGGARSLNVTVRVSVYDVTGRPVRVLFEGRLPADCRHVSWDGRDQRGQRVSSGVYFVQAVAGVDRTTRSVVLLR